MLSKIAIVYLMYLLLQLLDQAFIQQLNAIICSTLVTVIVSFHSTIAHFYKIMAHMPFPISRVCPFHLSFQAKRLFLPEIAVVKNVCCYNVRNFSQLGGV